MLELKKSQLLIEEGSNELTLTLTGESEELKSIYNRGVRAFNGIIPPSEGNIRHVADLDFDEEDGTRWRVQAEALA